MTDLALSRRAVTRALVTLPIIAVPSIAAATQRAGNEGDTAMNMHSTIAAPVGTSPIATDWHSALAALDTARNEREAFMANTLNPLYVAHEAGSSNHDAVVKAENDREPYDKAHGEALEALVATPAPTLAAVYTKVKEAIGDWYHEDADYSRFLLDNIMEDLERFGAAELP